MAFIQSRMGSQRFPGKSLKELCGAPLLFHVIERVKRVGNIDEIVVATSRKDEDEPINEFCKRIGIPCFRGARDNVLSRFFGAAVEFGPDVVLRVCGDNPLVSTEIMEGIIEVFDHEDCDFVSGVNLPIGCSSEGFTFSVLEHIHENATKDYYKEHIVTYVAENKDEFIIKHLQPPEYLRRPELRLTVDTKEDFELISEIYGKLYEEGSIVSLKAVIQFLDDNPETLKLNRMVTQRNPFKKQSNN